MELERLSYHFTVCKIGDCRQVDFTREFVFLAKTDEELSLVCESDYAPPNAIAAEAGWKALKICGILDFGMIGVIAKISTLLAQAGISVFVISTYNTDYILVKDKSMDKAVRALIDHGYVIRG